MLIDNFLFFLSLQSSSNYSDKFIIKQIIEESSKYGFQLQYLISNFA